MMQNADHPSGGKNRSKPVALRLDELLVSRGLAETRTQAQRLIMAGQVRLDDRIVDKAGKRVPADSNIQVKGGLPFVSRGGLKLDAALDAFGLDPTGWICADIGASTGGFTDCLLQRGAERVYAIDVGYGQLAWSLRTDPRVVAIERVNVRYLEALPERVALATVDVSFISLRTVLPRIVDLLEPGGQVVALIKPQFEVGRGRVGKGGVVRGSALHRAAIEQVLASSQKSLLATAGLIRSPITGPAGNIEFLVWLRLGWPPPDPASLRGWLDDCLGGE